MSRMRRHDGGRTQKSGGAKTGSAWGRIGGPNRELRDTEAYQSGRPTRTVFADCLKLDGPAGGEGYITSAISASTIVVTIVCADVRKLEVVVDNPNLSPIRLEVR